MDEGDQLTGEGWRETLDHLTRCRGALMAQRGMLIELATRRPETAEEMAARVAEIDEALQLNAKRTRQIRAILASHPPQPEFPPNGFERFMR